MQIRTYIAIFNNSFYRKARSRAADQHHLRQKFLTNVVVEAMRKNLYHAQGRDLDFDTLIKELVADYYEKLTFKSKQDNGLKPLPASKKDGLLKQPTDYLLNNIYLNGKPLIDDLEATNRLALKKHFDDIQDRKERDFFQFTAAPEGYEKLRKDAENARYKMRKYTTNSEQEKEFWLKLAEQYAAMDIADPEQFYIEKVKELNDIADIYGNGKTAKYNDKISRIKEMANAQNLSVFSKKGYGYRIADTEIDFKIPDQWNITANAQELQNYAKEFKAKYFADYDILLSTVHADENPDNPHLHLKLSGKNNKTGLFDIPDHYIRLVKENKPSEFLEIVPNGTTRTPELTEAQRKKIFSEFQNIVLKDFENNLNTKHQLATKVQIVKDPDQKINKSKKSSNDRRYNARNKLEEQNAQAEATLQETIKTNTEINLLNTDIRNQINDKVENFNLTLKEVVSYQKKITKSFNKMFSIIRDFVFNNIFDNQKYNSELFEIQNNATFAIAEINNNKDIDNNLRIELRDIIDDTIKENTSDLKQVVEEHKMLTYPSLQKDQIQAATAQIEEKWQEISEQLELPKIVENAPQIADLDNTNSIKSGKTKP